MKNIFKKNQIIITALAIMIAIAGYLNFSGNNNEDNLANGGAAEVLDYDTYSETMNDDITQSDYLSLGDTQDILDEAAVDITTDGETDSTDTADLPAEDGTSAEVANNDESAILDVSDSGEVVIKDNSEEGEETSAPGEAILVSTTTGPDFFASSKLSREQLRSKNKDDLMEIINSVNLTENAKENAVDTLINLTATSEKENATETLLEAKGFSDAIVTIIENGVDVVVNAASLTEQDVAQIQDIVMRKTGMAAGDIVIAPVVAHE